MNIKFKGEDDTFYHQLFIGEFKILPIFLYPFFFFPDIFILFPVYCHKHLVIV